MRFTLNNAPRVAVLLAIAGLAACHSNSTPGPAAAAKSDPDPTPELLSTLETRLAKAPEDLNLRQRLLYLYTASGDKLIGQPATIVARRKHILWLVEHHPDSKPARSVVAVIYTRPGDPDPDPDGYQEIKKIWLARAAPADAPTSILSGAGHFFRLNDRPLTEQLYLRAQAQDPKGHWAPELGRIYYEALVGATSINPDNSVRVTSLSEAHSPFAAKVRRLLDQTREPTTLDITGQLLGLQAPELYQKHAIDFDPVALAKKYINRAIELDPSRVFSHQILLDIDFKARGGIVPPIPDLPTARQRLESLATTPENTRSLPLSLLAQGAFLLAESSKNKQDTAQALDLAEKAARQAHDLAVRFPADPDSGTALYNSSNILGLLALRRGDRRAAIQEMLDAAQAPPTQELQYSMSDFTLMLPERLYQAGERASVADFLDRFAQSNVSSHGYLVESAKAIRAKKNPLWVTK